MNCDAAEQEIQNLLDLGKTPETAGEFAQHLNDCANCRKEAKEYFSMTKILGSDSFIHSPSRNQNFEELWKKSLAENAKTCNEHQAWKKRPDWIFALLAAAAILGVILLNTRDHFKPARKEINGHSAARPQKQEEKPKAIDLISTHEAMLFGDLEGNEKFAPPKEIILRDKKEAEALIEKHGIVKDSKSKHPPFFFSDVDYSKHMVVGLRGFAGKDDYFAAGAWEKGSKIQVTFIQAEGWARKTNLPVMEKKTMTHLYEYGYAFAVLALSEKKVIMEKEDVKYVNGNMFRNIIGNTFPNIVGNMIIRDEKSMKDHLSQAFSRESIPVDFEKECLLIYNLGPDIVDDHMVGHGIEYVRVMGDEITFNFSTRKTKITPLHCPAPRKEIRHAFVIPAKYKKTELMKNVAERIIK